MALSRDYVGKLSKRITFKNVVQTADDAGGNTESLTSVATVWAEVVPLNNSRLFENGILLQANTYRIRVRKDAVTPTVKMQIDYNGKTLVIQGAQDVAEEGFYWRILANELTNG